MEDNKTLTINELFTAITTSRIDVEDMITKATDKEAEFRHIMWHIPTGLRYLQDEKMAANISDFINRVSEELGVDKNKIFNEDGLLTDIEKLGASKIEVEVEPTEEPSEEPTAPTSTTTKEPEAKEESKTEENDEE